MQTLVLDAQSQDSTADVARAHGAEVIVRPWQGFSNARLFALSQVRTPWTLMIDADEALDPELRGAIERTNPTVDGFVLSRTTYYCGKPLRMWSGERILRLFRTDRVRLAAAPAAGGEADLHERWTCAGETAQLSGTLLHYSYPTHAAYRDKFERYTSIEARGIRGSRVAAVRAGFMVPIRFLWYAFARRAALDGTAGLRVAWYSALYPAVVQWKALRFDKLSAPSRRL